MAPDQCVASQTGLNRHQTADHLLGELAFGIKISGRMISLNHRDRPSGFQHPLQSRQGFKRLLQMLQHKADDHVIKTVGLKRQTENIRQTEGHIGESLFLNRNSGCTHRCRRNVDGGKMGLRILPCQDDGLRPDPAACFQDLTSRRIAGVIMEQSGQRVGLVEQTLVFPV